MFGLFEKPKLTTERYHVGRQGEYVMRVLGEFEKEGVILRSSTVKDDRYNITRYEFREGVIVDFIDSDKSREAAREFVVRHTLKKTPDYVKYALARAQAYSPATVSPRGREIISLERVIARAAER